MNEREFLLKLQERAEDQEKLMRDMLLPKIFVSIGIWFGNHPLRIIVPLAIILTLILHSVFGKKYDELILKFFGKL